MYLEESIYIYSLKGPQFFVSPRVHETSGPALVLPTTFKYVTFFISTHQNFQKRNATLAYKRVVFEFIHTPDSLFRSSSFIL
jgi:hypothetical protein